ncbi:MAG: aminotransferase class V-fold PLP-dependent enzyme [Faecalibacterium prausnitzii]
MLSTPLEHSSVSGSLEALQKQGYEVELLDILPDGTVDLADLKQRLRPDTVLVAVTAVDSELGVVQPIAEIAELLKAYPNCHFHVDATQAVGKIPVQFEGMDTMSLTAHKFYGLNGIGVLVKRLGLALPPLIHGGESTTPYRSGTPTVALACSLALALEKATAELPARAAARPQPERPTAHRAFPLSKSAHQQPGKRCAAYPEPECAGCKGYRVPAGVGRTRGMRLGQIRLFVRWVAFPRSACSQSRPAQRPVPLGASA